MKKIIFLLMAGILISCGDEERENEVELGDYNETEAHENPEIPAVNVAEDLVPVEDELTDTVEVEQDTVEAPIQTEEIIE